LFEFGIKKLLFIGTKAGILCKDTDYEVDKINLIESRQCNETYVVFDVTVKNCKGHSVRFQVGVYKDLCTGDISLVFINVVDILLKAGCDTGFLDHEYKKSLTWGEFQKDRKIQKLFFFGVNYIILEAIDECLLDISNYYVSTLYAAAIACDCGYTYYLFDALIWTPGLGYTEVIFVVKVNDCTGKKEIEKFILFYAQEVSIC